MGQTAVLCLYNAHCDWPVSQLLRVDVELDETAQVKCHVNSYSLYIERDTLH